MVIEVMFNNRARSVDEIRRNHPVLRCQQFEYSVHLRVDNGLRCKGTCAGWLYRSSLETRNGRLGIERRGKPRRTGRREAAGKAAGSTAGYGEKQKNPLAKPAGALRFINLKPNFYYELRALDVDEVECLYLIIIYMGLFPAGKPLGTLRGGDRDDVGEGEEFYFERHGWVIVEFIFYIEDGRIGEAIGKSL